MFDSKRFRALVERRGMRMGEIADELGICRVTLYRKINGESEFLRSEIEACCRCLEIENPSSIFFAEDNVS